MNSPADFVWRVALSLASLALAALPAHAHPGSGIAVDAHGVIYFLDTGAGVWRVDTLGRLTPIPSQRFHWMALDASDAFRSATLPSGAGWEIDRVSATPALLIASDFPVAVGRDGTLYYPTQGAPQLQILAQLPGEPARAFVTLPRTSARGALGWINGLAIGPDGSLYYTEDDAIRRITPDGQVRAVVKDLVLTGCASIPGNGADVGPFLRGLAVDAQGAIYAAASGCGRVIRITADGRVTTVIQTESPWSPTAVAVFGGDIYVEEYLHTAAEDRRAWVPRVRKISANGSSTIIAMVVRH